MSSSGNIAPSTGVNTNIGTGYTGGSVMGGSVGHMNNGGFGGGYVAPMSGGGIPMMPMMGMMPMQGQPNYNKDYQHFDDVSED